MSNKTQIREEPDWKSKYLELKLEYDGLLGWVNDMGFQLQLNYRNIRDMGFNKWQNRISSTITTPPSSKQD